jgi:hypothetical protein
LIVKHKLYLITMLISLLALIVLLHSSRTQAADDITCTIDFEASIHSGLSAGLSLKGDLVLTVDPAGSATGTLTQASGDIKAVGQLNGHAINLALELAPDSYIFGVGTLTGSFSDCTGQIGGPFAGPQAGDLGDWGYAIGGRTVK